MTSATAPSNRLSRILVGVAQNVGMPIGAYFVLIAIGADPVWALTGCAGVAVLVLAAEWSRTRRINALGALVLLRFGLSLALAWVTGDARVILVKDSAITLAIAVVAGASLLSRKPLIERIRRDLSGDAEGFEETVERSPVLYSIHRRLTVVWAAALAVEACVSASIALTAPITLAVIVTNITGPLVIVSLVAVTEWSVRRAASREQPSTPL
ncbi:VC0807 family protein [Rhodococcus sp. NBC_00294]|uniref:VC0807 family protein n=1 Tax=Rhodococcus sp. NBC_00294 TaxID=2976004 RepID=UPI002E2AC9BF|nr:VC0807 family protein [Rhodococcus sp. NBC_00294]